MTTFWKLFAGLCFVYVTFYAIRSFLLLKQTERLVATSETFPRDYFVGSATSTPVTYVALGDSTVQGVGATNLEETQVHQIAEKLAAKGTYVHVINLGRNGATSADVVNNQLDKDADYKPAVISLTYGANDATHFVKTTDFQANTQKILDTLRPLRPVIYFSLSPDLSLMPALPPPFGILAAYKTRQQNNSIAPYLNQTDIVTIDLYSKGRIPEKTLYAPDMFHPNGEGYSRWANLY